MRNPLHSIVWPAVASASVLFAFVGPLSAVPIRLANWNVANHPNNQEDVDDLTTILAHMGGLSTSSTTARPFDILSMAEMDNNSIASAVNITRSVYGNANYQSVLTTAGAGGDQTGFIYNASTVQLLGSTEIVGGSLTHDILRGQFRPVGTTGAADFYVYSIHLSSGDSSAVRATRLLEAESLRTNADLLGNANVIFAGDFNWQSSDELGANPVLSAFDALTNAGGNGKLRDPINQVGTWNDNPSFLATHTNNPRDAMDDRFDLQLLSDELFDGVGLEYIGGSYTVVANNGTHTLNGAITTGTGAPAAVMAALIRFSDHLPMFADYNVVPEPATATLVVAAALGLSRRRRSLK